MPILHMSEKCTHPGFSDIRGAVVLHATSLTRPKLVVCCICSVLLFVVGCCFTLDSYFVFCCYLLFDLVRMWWTPLIHSFVCSVLWASKFNWKSLHEEWNQSEDPLPQHKVIEERKRYINWVKITHVCEWDVLLECRAKQRLPWAGLATGSNLEVSDWK